MPQVPGPGIGSFSDRWNEGSMDFLDDDDDDDADDDDDDDDDDS